MITVSLFTTLLFASCAPAPRIDQNLLIKCNSINLPTSRSNFVSHFGLRDEINEAPSIASGIRGGKVTKQAIWRLDSENLIEAHDNIYVGPMTTTSMNLDTLLNDPLRKKHMTVTKIKEIDEFVVKSHKGNILYSSYSKKNVVEQGAAGNPLPAE